MDFDSLVRAIADVHERLLTQATKAVNVCLTLRNWLIGCYIREYELKGSDRATYREHLFDALAERLTARAVSNCNRRQLYRYRDFYRTYPGIVGTASPQLRDLLPAGKRAGAKVGPLAPQSGYTPQELVDRLSYSHFEEVMAIGDPLKRAFYEAECIRGHWSVRELRRQIASLYFERCGLSRNKPKLAALVRRNAEVALPAHVIRDPYVFEFLGLKPKEVVGESALEDALLDKLQDFLLELGRGFCFEARQRRLLIGGEHFFVDLAFYHRILKCHVLIELKVDGFSHEYLGQLNTYVTWFRSHEMAEGDNPPVGLLLCTQKNHALVEYALAGLDNRLFVSKYQLELPKKEEIRRFLEEQIHDQVACPPRRGEARRTPARPTQPTRRRRKAEAKERGHGQ
jgi:predicted nuclease of restriction endonuclease-like (RecB) superfamily